MLMQRQIQPAIENGVEQLNEAFFQALADDKPKLYKEFKKFLNDNFKTS